MSTVQRLLTLHTGQRRLSDIMRESLNDDILDSVLNEKHLAALDRRVGIVLAEIHLCVLRSRHQVIVDDGR